MMQQHKRQTWARFLSLAQSKLRLCLTNHRAGYSNYLACDWLSIVWVYSEQETENRPWASVSRPTSCCKILWSLEAVKFRFRPVQLLCNLKGITAAGLPRCLSNFRVIQSLYSQLQDFKTFGNKTSYHFVNRGPGSERWLQYGTSMASEILMIIWSHFSRIG